MRQQEIHIQAIYFEYNARMNSNKPLDGTIPHTPDPTVVTYTQVAFTQRENHYKELAQF